MWVFVDSGEAINLAQCHRLCRSQSGKKYQLKVFISSVGWEGLKHYSFDTEQEAQKELEKLMHLLNTGESLYDRPINWPL